MKDDFVVSEEQINALAEKCISWLENDVFFEVS